MGVMRFLLALSVLILHTAPDSAFPMVGGRVAVETFFMISGFYMALILNEKYAELSAILHESLVASNSKLSGGSSGDPLLLAGLCAVDHRRSDW